MNITEVGGDNFCTFHQQPHSEKKCPQWLNLMTLVMNKLLDSKLTKDSGKKEEKNQTIEKQDDDIIFLWNGSSLFNTEENALKSEYTLTATKDTHLTIKDNAIISKIKKLQENVKRQVVVNVKDKTPEVPTVSQEAKPINEPIKHVEWVDEGNIEEVEKLKEDIPTQNQPGEEDIEPSWEEKAKTLPFL